ncbi:hypothetical protein PMAYCL1PPCAC_31091 [Pristionchus mayeri]|uniref:Uncharacterized protein n=1 Tax=Pristionchus mayeri TaxID=1317129 RepID=A0AAN5DD97_9BILA|nr:hypothetical protein PMAYCL1PPCAC_31091 [Pristionchus mayeri]
MQQQNQQLQHQQYTQQQLQHMQQQQQPQLSTQPRSASMGSLPLGQQPPQYSYPYGQHPGQGQRPNGLNAYTANGTPVPSNWQMAYQTEMPPAFLNYYHPGKAHPYFDHARRNLHYPYPLGIKEIGDRPGEPGTFGFLPDSIYYDPANDRRNAKDGNLQMPGPSTSKASPKKRGAGAAGGAAGGAKKRRTNSVDQADDARFVQPYPPNMTAAQQQRMASTSSTMFPAASGASYDGFSQPGMSIQQQQAMMQQSQPHIQLQRQMSAPAYSGLSQSHAEAMQSARQQQAIANGETQTKLKK